MNSGHSYHNLCQNRSGDISFEEFCRPCRDSEDVAFFCCIGIPAYHQHTECCSAATVARSGGWSVEASRKEVQFISFKIITDSDIDYCNTV